MGRTLVKMEELNRVAGAPEQNEVKIMGKPSDYHRIHDRFGALGQLYDETKDMEYLMEHDSICHVMDAEHLGIYEKVVEVAKQKGVKRVIDIGCAYGHQSEVFLNQGVTYVGVSDNQSRFWNRDVFDYVVDSYPCELPIRKGDMGVSVLCLTWNVYLDEGEKTLREQCEALQRDFRQCLIYVQENHVDFLKGYFKTSECIEGNLYYLSNDEQKTHSF